MVWTTRTISYATISGSCAISPDGLTVAYGYSGGSGSDGVQVIKNYGTPAETTFFISNPSPGPPTYYGYGISLDSTGRFLGTTGIGGNSGPGAGTGDLYNVVVSSHQPNLKSAGQYIVSDSNIFAPSITSTSIFTLNISASGSFGTTGQVLSQTGTGIAWINGSTSTSVHSVTSGSYSVLISDYYVGCNGSGITIVLPLGSTIFTGKQYVIKDESGNALANNVTITPTSPNLIDGNTNVKLYTNYMSLTILWTGSLWSII